MARREAEADCMLSRRRRQTAATSAAMWATLVVSVRTSAPQSSTRPRQRTSTSTTAASRSRATSLTTMRYRRPTTAYNSKTSRVIDGGQTCRVIQQTLSDDGSRAPDAHVLIRIYQLPDGSSDAVRSIVLERPTTKASWTCGTCIPTTSGNECLRSGWSGWGTSTACIAGKGRGWSRRSIVQKWRKQYSPFGGKGPTKPSSIAASTSAGSMS